MGKHFIYQKVISICCNWYVIGREQTNAIWLCWKIFISVCLVLYIFCCRSFGLDFENVYVLTSTWNTQNSFILSATRKFKKKTHNVQWKIHPEALSAYHPIVVPVVHVVNVVAMETPIYGHLLCCRVHFCKV